MGNEFRYNDHWGGGNYLDGQIWSAEAGQYMETIRVTINDSSGLSSENIFRREFTVYATPKIPLTINDEIELLALDRDSRMPIRGANVDIFAPGLIARTQTDQKGEATFNYVQQGMVVRISMEGYEPFLLAIPISLDLWIWRVLTPFVSSLAVLASAVIYYLSSKRRRRYRQEDLS